MGVKEKTFNYISVGRESYRNVRSQILDKGYRLSTGEEVSSLIQAAYSPEEGNYKFFKIRKRIEKSAIRNLMDEGLFVFNRNLWTRDGVYVIQDSDSTKRNYELDIKNLEKVVNEGEKIDGVKFSKDKSIRFAPVGSYSGENYRIEKFTKDGFIIASFGKDGAEKIGNIAFNFGINFNDIPRTYLRSIQGDAPPIQTVSIITRKKYRKQAFVLIDALLDDDSYHGSGFGMYK